MTESTKKDESVGMRAIKLAGEALLVPGSSLLLDGKFEKGAVHLAAGLIAKVAFGLPGAVLVGLNSYAISTTGKGLLANITGSGGNDDAEQDPRAESLRTVVEQGVAANHTPEEILEGISEDVEDLYAELKHAHTSK